MNCLEFALNVWQKNPSYKIWYNSDHCINIPETCQNPFPNKEFLPIEEFGYNYFKDAFSELLEKKPKTKFLLIAYFTKDD